MSRMRLAAGHPFLAHRKYSASMALQCLSRDGTPHNHPDGCGITHAPQDAGVIQHTQQHQGHHIMGRSRFGMVDRKELYLSQDLARTLRAAE